MKRLAAVFGLCLGAAAAAVAGTAAASAPAREERLAEARFVPPPGWSAERGSFVGEPYVAFSSGPFTLRARRFGGKDSLYRAPGEFLAGPEARGEGDLPARRLASRSVAGRGAACYRRSFRRARGDPHALATGSDAVAEEFCLVPGRRGFYVLSLGASGPAVLSLDGARPAWTAFLERFREEAGR